MNFVLQKLLENTVVQKDLKRVVRSTHYNKNLRYCFCFPTSSLFPTYVSAMCAVKCLQELLNDAVYLPSIQLSNVASP